MNVGGLALQRDVVVCVGTGGVGKTTIAAAIGLGAALRGRRVAVLTIDPAHQLARSLGLDALRAGGQPVPDDALASAGLELRGSLDAGMLDQQRAWNAFITRLMPNPTARERVMASAFYRQLSSSFPGSNEYMAIEEMCRLAESGRYELIVLDTPPASHALEFLRAPERIDRLFDHGVFDLLARPYDAGRTAWRSLGHVADSVVRRLERAAGQSSLREVSDFLLAVHGRAADMIARSRLARSLLVGPSTAFVLVARPQPLVIDETAALRAQLAALGSPLAALVVNRVHSAPALGDAATARALSALHDRAAAAWIHWAWTDAVSEAHEQRRLISRLSALLPADAARAEIPERDRDVRGLRELAAIADALWAE